MLAKFLTTIHFPGTWEDKIFLTTAISKSDTTKLRAGAYVSSYPVEDGSVHDWKVYCFNQRNGNVYTLKNGPEFEALSENRLGDICMSVPALKDDAIFFRTQNSLIAVSKK